MATPDAVSKHSGSLKKISLLPFVAVLYAYCAGGPFGFEAMVSTSGPGMALLFILLVPWLFSVPVALATAEMATAMPVEGGFYRWTRAAFGDFWGFQSGWWNWTGTFFMWASYGTVLADYVSQVWPIRNPFLHWAIAFAFLLLVALLNVLGIRLVGHVTLWMVALQMVPVAIFCYLALNQARFSPFQPWMPPARPWREVYGVGLALGLWIYSGYEQLSTVIEEVEEPRRNFPRGLALVAPLAILSFFVPVAAGLAALGNWQAWETGYMVTAARLIGGHALEGAMLAAAVLCTFVLLDSTVLSVSRVPFAMAEDGYLHGALAKLHPRFGTPVLAILLSTAFCGVLAGLSVTQLIAIYAWMRAATSVLTLLSVWQLRRTHPELPRGFRVPGGTWGMASVVVVPTLLFGWALVNSDRSARLWGPLCLALGPVAYGVLKKTFHRRATIRPSS
ncbi:MAG: APC family permease [Acidobacteria bacterium]|nr:APC family permease [Acidobacteriota bacterium]